MSKKIISVILAAVLVLMMLSVASFAVTTKSMTINQLYVGRAFQNDSLDTIKGATAYKVNGSVPAGLKTSGSYSYSGNEGANMFKLAMSGTPTAAGNYSFTITYFDVAGGTPVAEVTYNMNIEANAPFEYLVLEKDQYGDYNSPRMASSPNKITGYYLGEKVDLTGMRILATVVKKTGSNSYEKVEDYDITSCCYLDRPVITADGQSFDTYVYVSLPTCSLISGNQISNVKDVPQKIEIAKIHITEFKYADPNEVIELLVSAAKTEYEVGESIDLATLDVSAKMGDQTTKSIDVGEVSLDVTSFSEAGDKTVTVTYKEKTATFDVTVKEPAAAAPVSSSSVPEVSSVPESSSVPEEASSEPEPESEPESIPEVIVEPEPTSEPEPESEPETEPEPETTKAGIPAWVWVIIAVVVLLVGGAVGLFFIGRKKNEEMDDE